MRISIYEKITAPTTGNSNNVTLNRKRIKNYVRLDIDFLCKAMFATFLKHLHFRIIRDLQHILSLKRV